MNSDTTKYDKKRGDNMDALAIGALLRTLRGDKTREEVAFANKISVSALAMYETGKRIPRDEKKMALANYYGMPVEAIFFTPEVHANENQ